MKRMTGRQQPQCRSGLSRIELFVAVLAVLLLLALILPAMNASRPVRRKMQCAINLKQLTLAANAYAESAKGKLPSLVDTPPGLCDASLPAPNDIPNAVGFHIALLPFLDQGGAIEYIIQQNSPVSANTALMQVLNGKYKTLVCPNSSIHFREPAGSSYVANCGYGEFTTNNGHFTREAGTHSAGNFKGWDLDPTSLSPLDKSIARATGVFWVRDSDGWQRSLDDLAEGDGAGQTIMFSENLNSGTLLQAGIDPLYCGFVAGRKSIRFNGTAPNYLAFDKISRPFEFEINSNRHLRGELSPIPSSIHDTNGRGVNVSFCDGHIGFLSERIDPSVYVRLMSPNGNQFGQTAVRDSEY